MGVGRHSNERWSVGGGGETTIVDAMEEGEDHSVLKWACSTLSSSEKFSSFYDTVVEASVDWERKKNMESQDRSSSGTGQNNNLQHSSSTVQQQQETAVPKPRSKIIFPHVMTRGSVVGNKVYCKTSINNCFTWRRQRSSSSNSLQLCASDSSGSSSMLMMNFYHERSSDIQSGIEKNNAPEEPSSSADPEEEGDNDHHEKKTTASGHQTLISHRCRTLLLSVAGAAGIQLLFPSLQLPLFEVLLLSHRKLPTRRCSIDRARGGGGGGWWRFPLNLALAISRPFSGSVLRRSLTAILFVSQLRVRKTIEQRSARYMPDLCVTLPLLEEKSTSVDRDLNPSTELLDMTRIDTEVEEILSSWKPNREDGEEEDSFRKEERSEMENSQDVISDDGLSSSGRSCEQEEISEDGLSSSSSGYFTEQDVISEEEISRISNSFLEDLEDDNSNNNKNLGQVSDGIYLESKEPSMVQLYDTTAFSQTYGQGASESPTETCSSIFTTASCSSSDFSTASSGSDLDSGLSPRGNSERSDSSCDLSISSVETEEDVVVIRNTHENTDEKHFSRIISSSSVGSGSESILTEKKESGLQERNSSLDIMTSLAESDPDKIFTTEDDEDPEERLFGSSSFSAGTDSEFTVAIGTPSASGPSTYSALSDGDSTINQEQDSEETHPNSDSFTSSPRKDDDSASTPKDDSKGIDGDHCSQDTFCSDLAEEERIPASWTRGSSSESCFSVEQQRQSEIPVEDDDDLKEEDDSSGRAVSPSMRDIDQFLFPFSEEFQFHDDIPPSPCEMMSQVSEFVPSSPYSSSSSEKLLGRPIRQTEKTTAGASTTSVIHVSPRADLTALMPEEVCSAAVDGAWEIKVDGFEVVWTPFKNKNKSVIVVDSSSSSEEEQEGDDDDTDSCKSADGSESGREEDSDERSDRIMLMEQNTNDDDDNDRQGEDFRASNSVQDRKSNNPRAETKSEKNFGVGFSSVNGFPVMDSKSSELEDAGDEHHQCAASTSHTQYDFEFQSVCSVNAGVLHSAHEAGEKLKVMKAITPRVRLTVRRSGEEMFGLRAVIPKLSETPSEKAPTENSLTGRGRDLSHEGSQGSPPEDALRTASKKELPSSAVVGSYPEEEEEEFDRVRVPVFARLDEKATTSAESTSVEKSKSRSASVSSSFFTVFTDDADTTSGASSASPTDASSESSEVSTSSSSTSGHFADHPTCIRLRKIRHSHGDQVYLEPSELLSEPWRNLVYWHGRCREGRPTLVVLLGKAVRQLSPLDLKHFITVTISHAEYAELNFFKGAVKQLNILMDLDGLGFMRLPPMHVLQSIGTVLNRDYAGRGGWLFMVNAPMMLGLVISAIQRVILRPSYTKGAVIDKGFLEGKDRIVTLGGRYKATLLNHFDEDMIPSSLGGTCSACSSKTSQCHLGFDLLPH